MRASERRACVRHMKGAHSVLADRALWERVALRVKTNERVHVLPGQTVTVWLYPTYLDFALVQEDGNRAPLPGKYTVKFGVKEAHAHGEGYLEAPLTARL